MSLEEKYSRVSNTYSYSIQSTQGDDNFDNIGSFRVEIPPFPFKENQSSQVGIFTLESFFIIGQTEADYVGAITAGLPASSDYDTSGFYVEVNGLGLRPQIHTTNLISNLRSNKMFPIINEYGSRRKADDDSHISSRVTSGGYSNKEVICSNPSGSVLHVKVYSMDSGDQLSSTTLDSVINFKIEMLPDEISNGM